MNETLRLVRQKVAQANPGKTARKKNEMIHREPPKVLRKFRREHGLHIWKNYSMLLRLPTWLVVIETLRRMAWMEQGMLGLVWKSIAGRHSPGSGTSDLTVIPIESSSVAEGMLWFPNLLLPDTSLLLPFMLSATLLTYSCLFAVRIQNPFSNQDPEPGIVVCIKNKAYGLRLSRLQKVLALAAWPATFQFPSAVSLY